MRHFLTLALMTALISLGHSLICYVCRAEGEFSCTVEEKTCPKEYACAATSTVIIKDGMATKSFTRSCEKRNACGVTGSIGFQKGKIKTATTCCYSDTCYPSAPALPTDDAQRNGLTCRSCTSHDSTWCHTEETIDCTGQENRCIFQANTYSGAKYSKDSVRGCGTKAICDMGSRIHNFGSTNLKTDITCSSDGFDLRSNFLLLALTVALVFKVML